MFEHAHARDLVVLAFVLHVAIVHAAARPPARTGPGARDLFVHIVALIVRQRDAARLNAVMLGCPQDQPAPAATDVEQAFAGLEIQLAADVIQLGLLRRIQAQSSGVLK